MTEQETRAVIDEMLAAKHPVTLGAIAHKLGVTDREAAHLLPEGVATFAPGADFEKVWETMAGWDKATLILVHKGHVIEVSAKLAAGKKAMGYYNIMGGKSALEGHIRSDDFVEIAFISMPFMGRESHYVAFFGGDGECAFSMYVGREHHVLIEAARRSFLEMKASYA